MNNHLKHIQAHLEAITGINSISTGSSINTSEDVIKQMAIQLKEKQIKAFLSCSSEQREAYLLVRRASEVYDKMSQAGNTTGASLNHLQSVFSINGYPGMAFKAELSLKDLEEAHANELLEKVVLSE